MLLRSGNMLHPCHGGSESQNQFPKIPSSNDLPQLQIMVMITGVSSPSVCLYGAVSYRDERGVPNVQKSVKVKVHGSLNIFLLNKKIVNLCLPSCLRYKQQSMGPFSLLRIFAH